MLGAVEVLRLVTDPGDAVVISPPVYPPFAAFVEHADRRLVNAPLGPDGRLDLESLDRAFAEAHRDGPPRRVPAVPPAQPHGHAAHRRPSCGRSASWPPGTASGWSPTRSTPRSCSAPGSRFVPTTTQIPDAIALHSASKAFNLAGLRAAVAVPGPDAVDDLARLPAVVGRRRHPPRRARSADGAYREGGAWLDEVLDGLRHNQRLVADLLADARAGRRLVTAGGDVLRVDRPARARRGPGGRGSRPGSPCTAAVSRSTPVRRSASRATGFVRLNLAASTATLTDAVGRLARALEDVATDS